MLSINILALYRYRDFPVGIFYFASPYTNITLQILILELSEMCTLLNHNNKALKIPFKPLFVLKHQRPQSPFHCHVLRI